MLSTNTPVKMPVLSTTLSFFTSSLDFTFENSKLFETVTLYNRLRYLILSHLDPGSGPG